MVERSTPQAMWQRGQLMRARSLYGGDMDCMARPFDLRPILMVLTIRAALSLISMCGGAQRCVGQSLSPRAYVIAPIHSNAITLTYSFQEGNIVFVPTLPISGASGRINTEVLGYFHTLDFLGRSANFVISLPYSTGSFEGSLSGPPGEIYRSGLAPGIFRFSVNLKGGAAMKLNEFVHWRQSTVLGASLTVDAQTGQYDPARLINIGANRWAFKPEVGFSRRWGRWILDAYGAVWLFTANNNYYPNSPGSSGSNKQTQEPMGAVETHISYDVRPRLWISMDGNYWYGGLTSVNNVPSPTTLQSNSRLGATAAIPFGGHQSIKFSYSDGTYYRFGGDYQTVSVAWQYSWLGRPN